jgi:antirestriction protein ArdC
MQDPINIQLSTEIGATGGAWLKLPATSEQLQTALARIGVPNGEQDKDFFITGLESPVAAVSRLSLENEQKAGIDELNYLAAALQSRDDRQIDKLNAASEMISGNGDIHRLTELTQNTDVYDFHPDIFSNIQLGEHCLEHSGLIQIPDEWAAAIDVEMLGQLAAANEKGKFTEYGYIAPNGEEWKPIKEIPQEYRIAPEIEKPQQDYDMVATTKAPPTQTAQTSTVIPLNLTAENPRERMKEITGKLEAGIKGIFESEQYKTYLKTLSKFHNYSMNNCLLIAMQKPDATQIAGFNAWRDDFKRQVLKGEKGIKIIAPSPFKTKKAVDRVDASGRPVFGKDGRRVKDEVEITVPAFKVATVFDVSQTEGEPLPQIGVDELTGSVDRYKEFFTALEKSAPVPVAFEPITSGAKGYYQQMEKRIAINEGMSELQNVKTLIHEIAHSRLHAIDTDKPIKGQDLPDRRTREVEAESIAYTVCQRYGLDTSDYSFAYVATWSGAKQLDALKSSLETIRKEADAIISEVDRHFTELQQEQTAEKPVPEKQPGYEKWSEPATPENAPENPGVPSDDISAYLPQQSQGDTFTIYQLKDGDETRDIRFEPLTALTAAGLAVEMANYDKTYTAPLAEGATLEKIYFTLNMDKPEDFKGHALSVSDVVVMNRDGKETAFYVDGKGFQELPNFLAPKEQAKTVDLKAVADYMQKLNDALQAAKPDSAMSVGAYNATVKRLEQSNAKIPDTQPQLKALISNAAQSPDLPTLKERMNTLHTEFIQHYATAAQMAIDTSGKAAPPAPAASQPNAAPKDPPRGENVAAIEAKVNAGETINLSDLAGAIKADKQAAQPTQTTGKTAAQSAARTQQPTPGAKQPYSRGKSAYTPAAPKNPSIKDKIQAGKDEIAAKKPAPSRSPQKAAAQNKNAGLGD